MIQAGGIWIPDAETWARAHLSDTPGFADAYDGALVDLALALPRRRRAIDVGASFGLWSRRLSKGFARVEAFEPLPDARRCFVRNVADGNVALHVFALGDRERSADLVTSARTSSGDYTTFKTFLRGAAGTTPVRTLDSFAFEDVDFIKIDCEGFDYYVILGALETILRCSPAVLFEAKQDVSRKRYGVAHRAPHELLEARGYVLRYEERGNFFYGKDEA